MKRIALSIICIISCSAAHVDLDKKRQLEFAQKRLSMMRSRLTDMGTQRDMIEKKLTSNTQNDTSLTQLDQLKANISNLQNQIVVTVNSILALTKK